MQDVLSAPGTVPPVRLTSPGHPERRAPDLIHAGPPAARRTRWVRPHGGKTRSTPPGVDRETHRGRRTDGTTQVRDARITDVGAITSLLDRQGIGEPHVEGVSDLLRQLIYLPNATVIVALAGRQMIGSAVLCLRPSIRQGGLVGTIDILATDPDLAGQLPAVGRTLLEEALRSARNKGCVQVEAGDPESVPGRDLWAAHGFLDGSPRPVLARVLPAPTGR